MQTVLFSQGFLIYEDIEKTVQFSYGKETKMENITLGIPTCLFHSLKHVLFLESFEFITKPLTDYISNLQQLLFMNLSRKTIE